MKMKHDKEMLVDGELLEFVGIEKDTGVPIYRAKAKK